MSDPPKKSSGGTIWVILGALVVLGFIGNAINGDDPSGGGGDTNSLDQRTCEIGRDIAGDYNVTDTFSRTQERIADLYSGYGSSASAPIASAVHDWSAGMTSGDIDLAIAGIDAFGSACAAEGF